MRGIVCAEIGRFELVDDLPEPVPQAGHAVVAVRRVGICGTDYHAYRGHQPYFAYPRILGHELAGVIAEVGPNGQGLRAGDPVSVIPYLHCGTCIACRSGKTNCCTNLKVLGVHVDGGLRERISVPVSHLMATPNLTPDETAAIEPLAIGAHAVRRSGLRAGETALVIGAGPIGLGVAAFAKRKGAKVIAMDVSDDRLAFCGRWAKADGLVNPLREPEPIERIAALNGGECPTVVFDATGSARSMADSFAYAAHGGTVVFVGLVKADVAFSDPEFHKRELTLMGSRNATREDFAEAADAIAAGGVDIGRYVTHRAGFADMIERFGDWLKPESNVIKAMVEMPI